MRGKYIAQSFATTEKYCSLWSFGREQDQLSGYLQNGFYNGFGRYVCQLNRVTLKFCKYTPSSKGVRDFIETGLIDYCRENPGVAVYLNPRRRKTPVLVCEYLNGSYHWQPLFGMSHQKLKLWLDLYTTRSGEPIKFFKKPIKCSWPSVQGPWNPFLNKPTDINVTELPSEERGRYIERKISATEQLLRMQEEGKLNSILFSDESTNEDKV